jgi:hypothetical protein
MSSHDLPGPADVAVRPGLQAAHWILVRPREAPGRGSRNYRQRAFHPPFRYRNVGSVACTSCGRFGPPQDGIPANSRDGR